MVVDLTHSMEFKFFHLADPPRVVVDMPEIDWHRLDHEGPLQGGAITRVRYGVLKPGTSRLVVDATEPLKVRSALLIGPRDGMPYRLVIYLQPAGRGPAGPVVARPVAAGPPPKPPPPPA